MTFVACRLMNSKILHDSRESIIVFEENDKKMKQIPIAQKTNTDEYLILIMLSSH